MRSGAKFERYYLYPKTVDFRKPIDCLATLVELDVKVAVFDILLFVFIDKFRNLFRILCGGWGLCLAQGNARA
ncbi:TPA: IS66 family insertion sequence element accessory protein TnpB [Pseudomonas putida]|nr:IS66 family insertion sequence element accessory protein TnpB [Pseudomonas putida]